MRAAIVLAAAGITAASASFAQEEHRITMLGSAYGPQVVEARVGDTLVFVNDDGVAHDVLIPTVGFATDLGSQDPGTETMLTVGKAGVFDVECVFHDHMHTRIIVTP